MLMVGRMGAHMVVINLEVLNDVMVLVVGNMVGMERCMVVKPKKIRWFPNQPSWLTMIRASLLLSLLIEFYIFEKKDRGLPGWFPRAGQLRC